jgi:hypothetical protein
VSVRISRIVEIDIKVDVTVYKCEPKIKDKIKLGAG